MSLATVLTEVIDERAKQDAKWGEQNHAPELWLAILTEETGEVAKEVAEGSAHPFDTVAYRTELIHVAAVAVQAVESLDRQAF